MEPARILVVEDHPSMRDAMRMVLAGEGYAIAEAVDGTSALSMAREDPPDLMFLDMNIPGTGGAEVLSSLKADPVTAGVRVIVVTAEGPEGRERALQLGADGYFTKPFSPAAMVRTVERVLGEPPGS